MLINSLLTANFPPLLAPPFNDTRINNSIRSNQRPFHPNAFPFPTGGGKEEQRGGRVLFAGISWPGCAEDTYGRTNEYSMKKGEAWSKVLKRTIGGPASWIPRNLLGNFSRQPNATVDFSAGRKTEISHSVLVRRSAHPLKRQPCWDQDLFKLPDVFPLFLLPLSSITRARLWFISWTKELGFVATFPLAKFSTLFSANIMRIYTRR